MQEPIARNMKTRRRSGEYCCVRDLRMVENFYRSPVTK